MFVGGYLQASEIDNLCKVLAEARLELQGHPATNKMYYISAFMDFGQNNGSINVSLAIPIVETVCPDWISEPASNEDAIRVATKIMIDLQFAKTLARIEEYVAVVVKYQAEEATWSKVVEKTKEDVRAEEAKRARTKEV